MKQYKKKTSCSQLNDEKSNWPGYILINIWITKMSSNNFKQINIYQHVLYCYAINTIDPAFREFITNVNDLLALR